MATFTLPVRHTREVTDIGVECREDNFRLGHREWTLPLAQCALVMVDCWDQHVVVSHLERGGRIAQRHILPVLEAFRDAGMLVVHAPSPEVADKYPQFVEYHDEMPPKPTVSSAIHIASTLPFRLPPRSAVLIHCVFGCGSGHLAAARFQDTQWSLRQLRPDR